VKIDWKIYATLARRSATGFVHTLLFPYRKGFNFTPDAACQLAVSSFWLLPWLLVVMLSIIGCQYKCQNVALNGLSKGRSRKVGFG